MALGVGLGLLLKTLWDLFNQRPKGQDVDAFTGQELILYPTGSGPFTLTYYIRTKVSLTTNCDSPAVPLIAPEESFGGVEIGCSGKGIRIGLVKGEGRTICGTSGGAPNSPSPAISQINANGSLTTIRNLNNGQVVASGGFNRQNTFSEAIEQVSIRNGSGEIFARTTLPGTETLPRPQAQLLPVPVPVVRAVAPTAPTPQTAPAPGPGLTPVPAPAAVPGGLPGGQPSVPRAPAPVGAPQRIFTRSTPGSLPQGVTATGPRPLPAPPIPQTAPGTTFLPGGPGLVGNGPPPTMQGVATELGKLEKKLEIALAPEGPLSLLQQVNRAIDQIENIRFVLDALFPEQPYQFPAGEYQLAPVCDRDSDGVLLPPRTAPWAAGQGEVVEVRRKVDALAALLQHHKDLKQPTCGPLGGGAGSNVTVHFESD